MISNRDPCIFNCFYFQASIKDSKQVIKMESCFTNQLLKKKRKEIDLSGQFLTDSFISCCDFIK